MGKKAKKLTEEELIGKIDDTADFIYRSLLDMKYEADMRSYERIGTLKSPEKEYPAEQGVSANDNISVIEEKAEENEYLFQEKEDSPSNIILRGISYSFAFVATSAIAGGLYAIKSPQAMQAIKAAFTP